MVWLPFKVTLACTNFALLCFQIILMVDHYASNYNLKSWSTVFHVLCFSWLSLRGAFWFLTLIASSKWGNSLFYLLYWVPCPLQFGSFLLLPLFFAQILYPKEWRTYWAYVCSIYITVVIGLTLFMVYWAILRERFDINCVESGGVSCFYSEYTSYPLRGVTAICFLFLALTQAAYGLKMAYLHKLQYVRFVISSRRGLAAVNIILVLSFLSRGLYQIVSITGGHSIQFPELPLEGETDVSLLLFAIFMFWDYIPLTLVIMTVTSHTSKVYSFVSKKLRSMSGVREEVTGMDSSSHLPFSYQSLAVQSQRQLLSQTQSPRSSIRMSPGRSLPSNAEDGSSTGMGLSRTSSNDFLKRDDLSRKPPINNRKNGVAAARDDSNFDLTKRFEAPASLTPISSWLSGLGHVPDDPQKYWRSNSPPDKDLLGYGISPIPVPFPIQNQSRVQSTSYEAGFAFEDLERAVLQAQKDERKRLEQHRLSKKKQELESNERIRGAALDREKDLERERERLRQLEVDRQVRYQDNFNEPGQLQVRAQRVQQQQQQPAHVSERTPLVQYVTGPPNGRPVSSHSQTVASSPLTSSRRGVDSQMLTTATGVQAVGQRSGQGPGVPDDSSLTGFVGAGDRYSHQAALHTRSRGYHDSGEDELVSRTDTVSGRPVTTASGEHVGRMRVYNNMNGVEAREALQPVSFPTVQALPTTTASGADRRTAHDSRSLALDSGGGNRERIQIDAVSNTTIAAFPITAIQLASHIGSGMIEQQSGRSRLSPAITGVPNSHVNQNPCP